MDQTDNKKREEKSKLSEFEQKLLEENQRIQAKAVKASDEAYVYYTKARSLEQKIEGFSFKMKWMWVLVGLLAVLLSWEVVTAMDYAEQLEKIAREKSATVDELQVGEHQRIPARYEVRITNPEPVIYADKTYSFGNRCYLEAGGTATIIARQSETKTIGIQERIENTYFLKYDGEVYEKDSCPDGVIFAEEFWKMSDFRKWSHEYARHVREREEEIARTKEVLSVGVLQVKSEK